MQSLIGMLTGMVAGVHVSTWGMYKDSPYEGFCPDKYARSILVGGAVGIVLQCWVQLDLTLPGNLVVFFGLAYVGERALVEAWKMFWRDEDQSKYTIPMRLAVFGRPVDNRIARLVIGAVYTTFLAGVCSAIATLQRLDIGMPQWLTILAVGSAFGWVSAFGGAWKDAPIEGFELLKFFRSPVVALSFAAMVASFCTDFLVVALATLGYTIAAIETYKTARTCTAPPGKFAGKPVRDPAALERRRRFVPLFVGIWLVLLLVLGFAFALPHEGLMPL